MRSIIFIVALMGCSQPAKQRLMIEHQSELIGTTRGAVLDEDEPVAQVGMLASTCAVDPRNGLIGDDRDVVLDEDDQVLDTRAGRTLVGGSTAIFALNSTGDGLLGEPTEQIVGAYRDARWIDDGVAVLDEQCRVWFNGIESGQVAGCSRILDVDRNGRLILHGESGLYEVTPQGPNLLNPEAKAGHWNRDSGVIVFSTESRLWSASSQGEAWSVDVNGLQSVAVGGPWIAASVVDGAGGKLVFFDSEDGVVLVEYPTPTVASLMSIGAEGTLLMAQVEGAVHWFSVSADEKQVGK